ncbi:hypothetical protein INS49_008807 [Diaporthe citri]|uniref:uncharacterized protein n=1 Tax=Diaporthe citri TaxID=83186 RepID=UPI001C818E4F|nr:uncharacterized protein INS49_008807 [Diaporthe citri]KAG6363706.1 hypothetical protein INS49_008807 [Diaporthe citri]
MIQPVPALFVALVPEAIAVGMASVGSVVPAAGSVVGGVADAIGTANNDNKLHRIKRVPQGAAGIWDHVVRLIFPEVEVSDVIEEPGVARSVDNEPPQDSGEEECISLRARHGAIASPALSFSAAGSITLVDLASHEKADVRADSAESKAINTSLIALIDALGQLKTALRRADSGDRKGQTEQKAQNKGKNQLVTGYSAGMSTPTQASKSRDIKQIWSSDLLPRVIGAMVLRGSESRSVDSTKSSENTMDSLKVLAQAK